MNDQNEKRKKEREKSLEEKRMKYESMTTSGVKAINSAMSAASQKERMREVIVAGEAESLLDLVKEKYKELTGKEVDFYEKKSQNGRVAFAQLIQHNIQLLVEYKYLTQSEKAFLFDLSGYLDFKTNIIVEKEYKNKKKKKDNENEIPKVATVSYIAKITGVTRVHASRMMNALKQKGVLATAETGMITDDGRPCTARTWFVNPNLVYCGDKNKIDTTVQLIFKDALKNIKDENGKKIELPIRLFI